MAYEEEAKQEVYYIPDNYDDAGGVLGGRFSTRNAIEMAVICGPVAFLELKFLRFPSWQVNVCIGLITILPLLILCAFGIGGESLSQIFAAYYRYRKGRRTLSYLCFTDAESDEEIVLEAETPRTDKKKTKAEKKEKTHETKMRKKHEYAPKKAEKPQAHKAPKEPPRQQRAPQEPPRYGYGTGGQQAVAAANSANIKKEFASDYAAWEAATRAAQANRAAEPKRTERKRPTTSNNKFLNSAMKEMLLRKLELGEDESA